MSAHLGAQGSACSRCARVRADGGTSVDVISVDRIANPTADGAAVIPTERERERKKEIK